MKKAMKRTVKGRRGDDYFNRLLSYFRRKFTERIVKMTPIRDSVFIIETDKGMYVIKGYPKYSKLKLQETFTATLRQEGFKRTYLYLQHLAYDQLIFNNEYFGCMEYLSPHQTAFSFHSHVNRKEGLQLLNEFHRVTASCVKRYKTLIPVNNILEKWKSRLASFQKNRPAIRYYINDKYIDEVINWAEWSLKGIESNEKFFLAKPHVILHGDVAHHNFLRDSSGKLNLIDFDLIGIGPECLDYLQYANRILPYINWSADQLFQYPQLKKFATEKAFLYALAYPTDILREWNRVMKDNNTVYSSYYKQVIDLTFDKFQLRRQFIEKLKTMISQL
jgi:thiamine kinase-like enzyme